MIQLFMSRSGSSAIVPLHFPASHDAMTEAVSRLDEASRTGKTETGSYTHLDVYKRQLLPRALLCNTGEAPLLVSRFNISLRQRVALHREKFAAIAEQAGCRACFSIKT